MFLDNRVIELNLDEVEYIIAFIRSHEWEDIPETIKDKILPKLEDFYNDCF